MCFCSPVCACCVVSLLLPFRILLPVVFFLLSTMATPSLASLRMLGYRVFEAMLSRCFLAEFEKPRSEVENDRDLGMKGSTAVAGKPDLMYGSIYEGVADFIFRAC
ncbi:unnamed protein product [Pylaiella littoralis]